jgi:hypothetical protein
MNLGEVAQLITAVATLIGVVRLGGKVKEVHTATNSKMDELLKLTASSSHAAGMKEQKDNE